MPQKSYKITYDGHVYRERDLTLDQIERAEELLGKTWFDIALLSSAKTARTILAIHHADATDRPYDDVHKEIGRLRTEEFLSFVEGDDREGVDHWEDGNPTAAAP